MTKSYGRIDYLRKSTHEDDNKFSFLSRQVHGSSSVLETARLSLDQQIAIENEINDKVLQEQEKMALSYQPIEEENQELSDAY